MKNAQKIIKNHAFLTFWLGFVIKFTALKKLFQMGLFIVDHCASEVGRSVPRLSFFPSWLLAEFSTFEVTIFGMGTERLRFLRGGSVVRPHVMPFNLEWMKNIVYIKYIFINYQRPSLYILLRCKDLLALFWQKFSKLNSSSADCKFGALWAVRSVWVVVFWQKIYAVKFEFDTSTEANLSN